MLTDLLRRLKPVHHRHGDVHQDHIRLEGERELDRLGAICGMTGNLDAVVGCEDRLERLRKQTMVVRDVSSEM